MEGAIALVAIALVGNKFIEILKAIKAKNWNTVSTLLILFVAGYAILSLAAHAAVTEHLLIPGVAIELGTLDFASLAILAWMITSTGSTVIDIKKAIDGSDSAQQNKLIE